ncbi:MAG: hypothetical protein DDT23_00881 [candidate division WS2 bacterium]|nr:hypothetical protein [Candidatus Lithacetigena glycinireducens]
MCLLPQKKRGKEMEQTEFRRNIEKAGRLAESANLPKHERFYIPILVKFWRGYQHGLCNYYSKDRLQSRGVPMNHTTKITNFETLGYQMGFAGMSVEEAQRSLSHLTDPFLKKYWGRVDEMKS